MNRKRAELYRNSEQGKIGGVCAGIADYFGWETWLIRILVVSGVLFGMHFLILGYIAGWFILDKSPVQVDSAIEHSESLFARSNQKDNKATDVDNESIKVKTRIWQSGEPPKQALYHISRKFRSLEGKLQAMEQYVTSAEFTVSREINKL